MPLAFTREITNWSLLLAKSVAEDIPPTCIPPLSQHSRFVYVSPSLAPFSGPLSVPQICSPKSLCGPTQLNPQLFSLHMYQLFVTLFLNKVGSQKATQPKSTKPPCIKSLILKHSHLWSPWLYFCTVSEGFSTLQTISAVFCTAREEYLSKKNIAVVILASVCSPSRTGAVGKKNRWKIRLDQSPLKSQFLNGISIWHRSSSAILGCGKGFSIKQFLESFLADLLKSSSLLMLRYYSY